jgi:hypothetical protein
VTARSRRIVTRPDVDRANGGVAILAHEAVGTPLHRRFAERAVDRRWDQPAHEGDSRFAFKVEPRREALPDRQAVDAGAPHA